MSMQTLLRVSVLVALFLATPGLCLANEGKGEKVDVLSPNLVNSIVTVVVFLGLLAVLYKFAWPQIQAGLAAREEAQFRALEDAKKARDEAEAVRLKVATEMDAAAARVKAIFEEARKEAAVLRTNEREAGIKEAEAKKEQAEREIAASREAMIKDLYEKAVQLATLMSEKALRREISAADHSRLLDESLAELRAANKA
jgi:F-type H+-transporting ATPase subunit b